MSGFESGTIQQDAMNNQPGQTMAMTSLNPKPKRNKRDQRPAKPRPMRETARDHELVRLVYDYRLLSQSQVERLAGKARSTIQQSLIRLYHHRYLERVFLPVAAYGSSPTFYTLDKRGIELLQRTGITDFTGLVAKDVSSMFVEHTMAINETRIAVTLACRQLGWQVKRWQTENEVKADYDKVQLRTPNGKLHKVPVVPDGFFVVEIPGRGVSHFFLEVDRGTMSLERFRTKVMGYVAYYKHGLYEKRYHAQGFRVLTVVDTPTAARLANLVGQTAKVEGIGRRFWFAHLPDLRPEAILTHPIWTVAGDSTPTALFQV